MNIDKSVIGKKVMVTYSYFKTTSTDGGLHSTGKFVGYNDDHIKIQEMAWFSPHIIPLDTIISIEEIV